MQDQTVGLVGATFALWLAGFGVAMVMQLHGHYLRATRRIFQWAASRVGRSVLALWRRYRTQIVWFAIGVAVAMLVQNR